VSVRGPRPAPSGAGAAQSIQPASLRWRRRLVERLTFRFGFVLSAPPKFPAERRSSARLEFPMAKPASIKIRLNSSADTGFFYVTKKNARTKTDKLVMTKYDPVVRKHVEFREGKIK
jgi:large subunit ribosomal protein L33